MAFRTLWTPRMVGLLALGTFACAPLAAGCGGSSSGDDNTSADTGGDETGDETLTDSTVTPPDSSTDTGGGGDTTVDDSTVADSGSDTAVADSGTDTAVADSGTDTTVTDSGIDTAVTDSGSDTAVTDTAVTDTADADAGPSCPPASKCTTTGGGNGICQSDGVTCGCTDPTDDGACTSTYGATGTNPYLCSGGACVPGNCRVAGTPTCSAPTPTCGFSTPNFCGGCTSDADCAGGAICNTTTGACVVNVCTSTAVTGTKTACGVNPADICCPTTNPATTVGACSGGGTGACCVDSDCGTTGVTCKRTSGAAFGPGICTTCTLVSGTAPTYFVDPVAGNDAGGSGSAYGGCAFKTVTRALQFIGATPAANTTIKVKGGTSLVAASEILPIVIPTNITIVGDTGGATLTLPAGKSGFTLTSPSSGLQTFTIDGNAHAGVFGLLVGAGSSSTTTAIAHVTIQHTGREGILVGAGALKTAGLAIGAGVVVTDSGQTSARFPGMHVGNNGTVVVTVPSGSDSTRFNGNSQHGILVDGSGSITITGATSGTSGTITANENFVAGLWIGQTPTTTGSPPINVINGLVTSNNGTAASGANGIHLLGGSNVKIRNSISLANKGNGLVITPFVAGASRNSNIGSFDLGTNATTDAGKNVFQALSTAGPNLGTGICLAIDPVATGGSPQTLKAEGNTFEGKDCSTSSPGAIVKTNRCNGAGDISSNNTTNVIDVANCTAP